MEDELPSPDASPMDIGHGVTLLSAQVEEEVDLAQVLAEFNSLPAIVTPLHNPQEERVVHSGGVSHAGCSCGFVGDTGGADSGA